MSVNKERIIFIDQLKGLAMLMVVFGHILNFGVGIKHSTLLTMLTIFDLPLFFFISGYFCYKERVFEPKELLAFLAKKIHNYYVPFIAVALVYCLLFQDSLKGMLLSGGGQILVFALSMFYFSFVYCT